MSALPIDEVIPEIRETLRASTRLILAAPPGAGKTTRVPLALLEEPWLSDKRILLLEPRRIAARMAADRMAATLGEKTGGAIGLSTRVDRKISARTRIEVITDGLFTRRILNDPELSGVGAVLFDEFHERSLNLDTGLAFALDAQAGLRPDIRLILMSATLDTARVAKAVDAPTIESDGRSYPVETIYAGKSDERLESYMARIIRRALREQPGSILAFLPGMGEILRTAEQLGDLPDDIIVAPIYGALSPADQDKAVAPAPPGKRKIVLSTDIAESSLTIEGVTTVVDAGLARVAEYDASAGASFLVTRRASRANVDQRCGRAGRLGPGVCYRLWDEEATRGLAAEPVPEILASGLSGLALALAEWGERDPARLIWIDPPPAGRFLAAQEELRAFGAIDAAGALTERGRKMSALPVEPQLAAMIAGAATPEDAALAAEIAVLVSERGLGGNVVDLRDRIERFRRDSSSRAKALREQASRWSRGANPSPTAAAGRVIAASVASMIARAKGGGQFQLANGRAASVDAASPLAREKWLAVADLTGAAANARILSAAPLDEADALRLGGVATEDIAEFDPERASFRARRVRRLGAIILSETPLPAPSGEIAKQAIINAMRRHGLGLLGAVGAVRETQARLRLAREYSGEDWPALDDDTLLARADEWLTPLLGDPPDLNRPGADQIRRGALSLLDWNIARKLDDLAPLTIETPAGRTLTIDYLHEGGPQIEARAQEFYGIFEHPAVMRGKLRLTVSLLSPARRQIALTKDLPAFWRGGYRDMAKDMRSQYPKHDWPDDPANAKAHVGKTKAALKRDN